MPEDTSSSESTSFADISARQVLPSRGITCPQACFGRPLCRVGNTACACSRRLTVVSGHVHRDDLHQAVALGELPQEQLRDEEEEDEVLVVCRDALRHGAATTRKVSRKPARAAAGRRVACLFRQNSTVSANLHHYVQKQVQLLSKCTVFL